VFGNCVCCHCGLLKGAGIADWAERRLVRFPAHLGHNVATRIREFRMIEHYPRPISMIAVTALSLLMWFMIVVAYQNGPLLSSGKLFAINKLENPKERILILMGASMVGSFVQLPVSAADRSWQPSRPLEKVFDVPKELRRAAHYALAVTFVAVVRWTASRSLGRLSLRNCPKTEVAEETESIESRPSGFLIRGAGAISCNWSELLMKRDKTMLRSCLL